MGNEYRMSCDGAGAGDGSGGPGPADLETSPDVGVLGVGGPGAYRGGPAPGYTQSIDLDKSAITGAEGAGEIRGLGGGGGPVGGLEAIKEEKKPIVPEVTPEVTKEKEKEKEKEVKGVPKAKKRQRRPTILTDEEGGLMYTAPGKRRSLLGG